jgi:hypothetical protein
MECITASTQQPGDLNHLYTILICILLIVQDELLLGALVGTHGTDAPPAKIQLSYYKEVSSLELSIMDALLLVLYKVMNIAIYRLQDAYLLSNLCAVLMNALPHAQYMHAYVNERIVKNILTLCKKVIEDQETTSINLDA